MIDPAYVSYVDTVLAEMETRRVYANDLPGQRWMACPPPAEAHIELAVAPLLRWRHKPKGFTRADLPMAAWSEYEGWSYGPVDDESGQWQWARHVGDSIFTTPAVIAHVVQDVLHWGAQHGSISEPSYYRDGTVRCFLAACTESLRRLSPAANECSTSRP